MSDAPDRIYLNVHPDDAEGTDFDDEGVTWCQEPIHNTDIEYIRADLYQSQAERIAELEEMVLKHVKLCDANELRAERDNLKAIIEKHIYDEGSYPND